jgi:Holliday junction resolvase RusA-like endonuclease
MPAASWASMSSRNCSDVYRSPAWCLLLWIEKIGCGAGVYGLAPARQSERSPLRPVGAPPSSPLLPLSVTPCRSPLPFPDRAPSLLCEPPVTSPLYIAFIPGLTPGKARPRVTIHGTHMPPRYSQWMSSSMAPLIKANSRHITITCPVHVAIEVILPAPLRRPRSAARRGLYRTPSEADGEPFRWVGKPDVDNAAGSVLDALVRAGVLADDTLVSMLSASLWATHNPAHVGATIEITDIHR